MWGMGKLSAAGVRAATRPDLLGVSVVSSATFAMTVASPTFSQSPLRVNRAMNWSAMAIDSWRQSSPPLSIESERLHRAGVEPAIAVAPLGTQVAYIVVDALVAISEDRLKGPNIVITRPDRAGCRVGDETVSL